MKGKKKELLTLDNILSKVSEYDIYRYYIGRDFDLNKVFKSPIPGRKDDTPSFIVGNKTGSLYHFDFGDSSSRGTVINFVEQMTGLKSFNDVLKRIDADLGLGISHGEATYLTTIVNYKKPTIEPVKKDTLIQVKAKRFDQNELNYWKQFHIDIEDLKKENVFSVKEVYLNKIKVPVLPTEMVFGYLYDDKWKIYRPLADDKKKKWMTNVPIDRMGGLENIKDCSKAIVTKAKKDKMVISKVFPCVCYVQAETIVGINEDNLAYLRSNSNEIYINFDSDQPGKKNSWEYSKTFGFKHINVPDRYLTEGIKDFADFVKKYGLSALEVYLKLKEII